MTTSVKQTSLFGGDESKSSPVAFLVNRTQWQGNEKAQKILDISGQKCLEQFESAGRPGLWAKTFLGLLIGQEGWFSIRCALTWKVKGTRYNRLYCQLAVSTLRTDEIGFGLLPTPTAMDSSGATANMKSTQVKEGSMHSVTLSRWAGMLPTVRARAAGGNCSNNREKGNLEDVIASIMLPTPATRDWKGARSEEALEKAGRNHTNSLPDAFHQPGKTSQLNPRFVAEMMGFPTDWTLLPFLNGETNQSKQPEMP